MYRVIILVCGILLLLGGCDDGVVTPPDTGVGDDSGISSDAGPGDDDAGPGDDDAGPGDAGRPDPCDPNPCMNGGTCSAPADAPVCDCDGTGFRGDTCETAIPSTIGVSWDDSPTLEETDEAGQTPTASWNNALGAGPGQGDDGMKADLVGADGVATGVAVSWSCQDIETTTLSGGPSADHTMMLQGCRSWQGMGDATFTIENLNAHFPDSYDVVVYIGRGGGFPASHMATFTLDVGSDSVMGAVMPTFDGTYDLLEGAGDGGNYYVSPMHTEDTLTLDLAATGAATLPTAAVNGIQLIAR